MSEQIVVQSSSARHSMRAFKKFTTCFFCTLFHEPFQLSVCFTIITPSLTYVWCGKIRSYLCLSKQDLDLLTSFQTLLFWIRPGDLKQQVLIWQANRRGSKLTITPLLCSPIKVYLLIAEENNCIIPCVQCRAPVGTREKMERHIRSSQTAEETQHCFPAVQATLTHWDQPAWWQFCWCRAGLSVFNRVLGATEQSSQHSQKPKCELRIKECRSSLSNCYSTLESSSFSKWLPDYVQGHLDTSFGHR